MLTINYGWSSFLLQLWTISRTKPCEMVWPSGVFTSMAGIFIHKIHFDGPKCPVTRPGKPTKNYGKLPIYSGFTIWLFNIAMENPL